MVRMTRYQSMSVYKNTFSEDTWIFLCFVYLTHLIVWVKYIDEIMIVTNKWNIIFIIF